MKSVLSIYSDLNVDNYKIILNEIFKRDYTDLEFNTILGRNVDYILTESYFIPNIKKNIEDGKISSMVKNKGMVILEKIVEDILK